MRSMQVSLLVVMSTCYLVTNILTTLRKRKMNPSREGVGLQFMSHWYLDDSAPKSEDYDNHKNNPGMIMTMTENNHYQ
jgi:hypothetical protein